jgi:hypothetical protein
MRYWAFMNGEVPGSYTAEELAALQGFSLTTLVCPAQGEISEKNWRRAGEFGDIASAIAQREQAAPPPAPAPSLSSAAASTASGADVNALIDSASTRLFSHVADLMKELENRRDEKGLILSHQRQISALKEELSQTRERANLLEMRLPRIAELEEAARKDHSALVALQSSLATREQALNETRIAAEKLRNEFESAKRRLQETANDLALRNRLVDKLSKELTEKDLSLAKSLGVIRRLEEDLNRLCPPDVSQAAPAAIISAPAASAPPPAPVARPSALPPPAPAARPISTPPEAVASEEPPALTGPAIPLAPEPLEPVALKPETPKALPPSPTPYTLDEPPPTPPYLEAMPTADRPKAQQALVSFLKRIFPGQPH